MKSLLRQEKTLLAIILFIALFGRLAVTSYGILTRGEEFLFSFDDAVGYAKIAANLAAGRGFVIEHIDHAVFQETGRTPGYPALIAASLTLFKSVFPVMALQMILGSIIPLLAYLLATRIFGSKKIAALTALFCAVEPLMVIITPLLLTETLFITLFWGALLLLLAAVDEEKNHEMVTNPCFVANAQDFERDKDGRGGRIWKYTLTRTDAVVAKILRVQQNKGVCNHLYLLRLALAGLLVGSAALVRPVMLYAIPVLIIFIACQILQKKQISFARKKAFAAVSVFAAMICLLTVPWMARNHRITGSYGLTSLSGTVGYFYTGVSVVSIATGKPYPAVRKELRQKAIDDLGPNGPRDPKNLRYFQQKTREIIMRHPKEFAQSTVLSLFHFFTHDGYYDTFQRTGLAGTAPKGASQITLIARGEFGTFGAIARQYFAWPWIIFVASRLAWIGIFIFSIIGFIGLWRRRAVPRPMLALVFFLIAAFALPTSMVALGTHGRLRMPLNAFIAPLAFIGFLSLTRTIKNAIVKKL